MAILSWIIFTVAIGFIKPPPHSCWREMNATHQIIERVGYSTSTLTSTVKVIVKRQTFKLSTSSLKKTTEIINNLNRSMNSTVSSSSRRRKPLIKQQLYLKILIKKMMILKVMKKIIRLKKLIE
jgi:hypothetical protein